VSNKPAQPHQKRSIVGGESVKYFEFGIAAKQSKAKPNAPINALEI
jgi:hypothetical protein